MKHQKLMARLAAFKKRPSVMAGKARSGLRWIMLAPLVALSTSPAWAALPSVTAPTDGIDGSTCSDGDIMCSVGAYFKEAIGIFAIIVASLFLIYYALGSFSRWKAYSSGRADASDLKEFVMYGGLIAGVVLLVAYLATKYAGITS